MNNHLQIQVQDTFIPPVYQTQYSKRKGKYLSGSLGFNRRGRFFGGFARNQVLALADKVVDAAKSGAIECFIVMAGCDGHHKTLTLRR